MWTATVTSKDFSEGAYIFTVLFTKGDKSFSERFSTSVYQMPDWLENLVKARIVSLEKLDAFVSTVNLGEIDLASNEVTQLETDVQGILTPVVVPEVIP